MAEVTAFRNNCLPYPVYGLPYVVQFPILDNTGALVSGAAGLDSEVSLNGNTYADATNEATEIATSSGMYYLILGGAEMQTQNLGIIVKTSTTNAKTTPMVLNPRRLVVLTSGTTVGGSSNTVQLDPLESHVDDFFNGCAIGCVIDGTTETRLIIDYDGASQTAQVSANWVTATPDSDDSYAIYLPEGRQVNQANTTAIDGTAGAATTIASGVWNALTTGMNTVNSIGRLIVQFLPQGWRQP